MKKTLTFLFAVIALVTVVSPLTAREHHRHRGNRVSVNVDVGARPVCGPVCRPVYYRPVYRAPVHCVPMVPCYSERVVLYPAPCYEPDYYYSRPSSIQWGFSFSSGCCR